MGKARRMPFFEVVNTPGGAGGGAGSSPASTGRSGVGPVRPSPPGPSAPAPGVAGGRSGLAPTHDLPAEAPPGAAHSARPGALRSLLGAARPASRPNPQPQPEPELLEGPPESAGPEAPKVIALSSNTVLIAAAVVVVVMVILWSIAYKAGQSSERGRLPSDSAFVNGDSPALPPDSTPVIKDPIGRNDPGSQPAQPDRRAATPPKPDLTQGEPVPVPAVKDGILGVDPRQPGNNYLELGIFAYRDAAEAIAFLKANGTDAAAVPLKGVDPEQAKAKNSNCLVFLLEGVPSGSFKTSGRVNEIVSEVRRLGKIFQKQHRGASDFSEPLWRLKRN